ncbi:hypothetical protein ACWEAF_05695 [Streptomyces sp. NPDC005071]
MKRLWAVIVALAAGLTVALSTAGPAAAFTVEVYQPCPTGYEFADDVNNIPVTCEPMTQDGPWLWLPILHANPTPTAHELDPCPTPGLVANKVGGGTLVCERHFDSFYYWARSV